ncbi:glutaredoxin family protein [Desulfovibrio aminophilus]|nr:glutaredoxin family protein [Desulfovibrio aminophilus]MCM0754494.1 glutaredoxin family protein [Desulfovibrio aminophilus]
MSHDIRLYALSTCIHCKNTKAYLDECGDAYECVFVDKLEGEERKRIIDEVKKLNPAVSFPTMVIDGEVIVGFNKDRINKALGK